MSMAPTRWAMDLTTGVEIKEINSATTRAAATRAMTGSSNVMLIVSSFGC